MISHRHAKANNPEIPNFDPSLPESYLLYIDANVGEMLLYEIFFFIFN